MKRIVLLISLLLSLGIAHASDTLTIRRVYSFDIGDTFDYHIQSYGALYSNPTVSLFTIVITGKWYSPAQDTLYYARIRDHVPDTISYTHLDDFIALEDTPQHYCPCYRTFTKDSACGALRNSIFWSNGGDYFDYDYIEGLGKVVGAKGRDDGSQTDTALNSYVKGSTRGQTPYYYTAISEIAQSAPIISLYPNPSQGILHLSFSDAGKYQVRLVLSDILGREVYTFAIAERETSHDISALPPGIYIWRISTDRGTIKTGKLFKQ